MPASGNAESDPPDRDSAIRDRLDHHYALQHKYHHVVDVLPQEPLERYVIGGFHPVALGDRFRDGRYIIRHKLGHGGYSTVWLAEDSQQKQWVSIKVKQARVSMDQLEQDTEIKALRLLEQKYNDDNPMRRRHFARILDWFYHKGPNGTHTCIVTELLGPTLSRVLQVYNDFTIQETLRPDTILRASRELLESVSESHKAGITHGDISPSNIAFTCNSALESEEYFWEALGGDPTTAAYKSEDPRPLGLPKHLVKEADWGAWYDEPEEGVCLIDWGESFPVGETRSVVAQPVDLRSPETFFIKSFDYHHDLWRAGCVWEEMMKNDPKSDPNEPLKQDDHLDEIFEPRLNTIKSNIEQSEHYEKTDYTEEDLSSLRCLLNAMKGLMHHEPDRRISATEAASYIRWIDHWRE